MHFTRTVTDFIMLIQYYFHDDDILFYIEKAVRQINLLKNVFQEFHIDKNDEEDYFNFLKFHLISYYVNFIKLYDSTCGYNSNTATETLYKYLIKNFNNYINKRCDFKT